MGFGEKVTCYKCRCILTESRDVYLFKGNVCCETCYHHEMLDEGEKSLTPHGEKVLRPAHYHKYNMDTITFLREGFPPDVLRGFLIGNVIKYTQRYQLKNGIEDLDKALNYMQILREEELKNHS